MPNLRILDSAKKKVSIVVPFCNRLELLRETLFSLIDQSYTEWECILVDDYSTADPYDFLSPFLSDNRIKYFKNGYGKGAPAARNFGLDQSSGSYLIFLDSDDILFHKCLELRVSFLEQHPELSFCVADGLRGYYPLSVEHRYFQISTLKSKNVANEFLLLRGPWLIFNVMYVSEHLKKSGIRWNDTLKSFQDTDFHIRYMILNNRFAFCEHGPDCLWRKHEDVSIGLVQSKTSDLRFYGYYNIFNSFSSLNVPKCLLYELFGVVLTSFTFTNLSIPLPKQLFSFITKNSIRQQLLREISRLIRFLTFYNCRLIKFPLSLVMRYLLLPSRVFKATPNVHFLTREVQFNELCDLYSINRS